MLLITPFIAYADSSPRLIDYEAVLKVFGYSNPSQSETNFSIIELGVVSSNTFGRFENETRIDSCTELYTAIYFFLYYDTVNINKKIFQYLNIEIFHGNNRMLIEFSHMLMISKKNFSTTVY